MRHFLKPLHVLKTAVMQRPEQRRKRARRRLEKRGQIDVIGAEPHAELAQRGAVLLGESLHVLGDARAVQHAQFFGELEGDAARHPFQAFALLQLLERPEQLLDMLREPEVEALLDLLQSRSCQLLVGKHARRRRQHAGAGGDFPHGFAEPANQAVIAEREGVVDRVEDAGRPRLEFSSERLLRRRVQRLGRFARRAGIRREAKSLEASDMLAFDQNVAGGVDFGFKHRILS